MSLLKNLFKKKESTCCTVKIEEVKNEKETCCNSEDKSNSDKK